MNHLDMKRTVEPIIVTGMHRSGTTLVTRLLESFNVFFGLYKDVNNEATFFLKRNEAILKFLGFDWSRMQEFSYSLDEFDRSGELTEKLISDVNGLPIIVYLGLVDYIKFKSLKNIDYPWGWKDPRNTILLPFWLKLFPNAKILNIVRNGVDVASSLVTREKKRTRRLSNSNKRYGIARLYNRLDYFLVAKQYQADPVVSLNDDLGISDAFQIWVDYVCHFQELIKQNEISVLTVQYEKLVSDVEDTLLEILRYLEIEVDYDQVGKVVHSINKSRGMAFLNNDSLVEFYHSVRNHPLMHSHGYHKIL